MDIARGRLRDPTKAPDRGEDTIRLAMVGPVAVDQILSGRLDAPVDYRADVDEWVVVLAGRARLEVAETAIVLEAGDWLFLPAGTPHHLTETTPGTSWLTVTDRKRRTGVV